MNATDLQNATAEDILSWTYRRFGRVALVASFQAESMVLIDLACRIEVVGPAKPKMALQLSAHSYRL